MFEGLTEFCFVFRFGFRASLLDFTSRIERLHVCNYCADVRSVLAYFLAHTVTHVRLQAGHLQRVYVAVFMTRGVVAISCSRSTVAVAGILVFVARCALVRNA